MRALHVATIGWRAEDGIARAAAAIAARLPGEHHLAADSPAGAAAGSFADAHVLPGPGSRLPWGDAFAALVQRLEPDVVHVHGGLLAPTVALAPGVRGRRVVASVYHAPDLPPLWSGPRRWADHRTSSVVTWRAATMRLAGPALARRLLRSGRLAGLATSVPAVAAALAGVGPVVLAPAGAAVTDRRARWSASPVIAFAGKAERARGIDVTFDAFDRVRAQLPAARLRLALLGGAAAEQARRRAAATPGVECTVGPVDDLAAVFAGAQVAAYPFRWSATMTPPLAAAEAMAVGLPVVATPVGCLGDLVHDGIDGAVVPIDDADALAAALLGVLTDPGRWHRLSAGAVANIDERWSWDRAAELIAPLHRSRLPTDVHP